MAGSKSFTLCFYLSKISSILSATYVVSPTARDRISSEERKRGKAYFQIYHRLVTQDFKMKRREHRDSDSVSDVTQV